MTQYPIYKKDFRYIYTGRLKVKEYENTHHVNTNQTTGLAILYIKCKNRFQSKENYQGKWGELHMIKGSIQPEATAMLNIYAPNRAS